MSDEARAVARGLTKMSRAALAWPKACDDDSVRLEPRALYSQTIFALERRGLVDSTYHLTPLGLAVRAILLEQPHD